MTQTALHVVRGTRKLESWVGGFMAYSAGTNSNEAFRRWTAIATVAAALERRVYIKSQGKELYPNLYTFLVGPPGIGKTGVMALAMNILNQLCDDTGDPNKLHIARVSLSKAALMDQLAESNRILGEGSFNSLMIASYELSALIPTYDADFLNALTYLYDCLKYDEDRRGAKEALIIPKPVVNILAACTPGYLVSTMPLAAWDQGFLARVIVIYGDLGDRQKLNLNADALGDSTGLEADLIHDIEAITQLQGKWPFEDNTAAALEEWCTSQGPSTAPTHPRLQYYNTRRPVHLLKLCLVSAVDAGRRTITMADFETAKNWLREAEKMMPNIFTVMSSGGDAQVMNECWHWTITQWTRTNQPVPRSVIFQWLANRIPVMNVTRMIEEMIRARMFERAPNGEDILPRAVFQSVFK